MIDDTESKDRDSTPQLDREQEGELTGDGINTSLSVRLQTEESKLEQEWTRRTPECFVRQKILKPHNSMAGRQLSLCSLPLGVAGRKVVLQ